ncbi:MAG TPA: hypothetical protein VMM93_12570 [Vicinamibacterales bacterium]|nr:hypothetical protein [Vicinamibacterales bacterium]
MHDYFEILGVAPDAAARDIKAACARHAARPLNDLLEAEHRPNGRDAPGAFDTLGVPERVDIAIDFPDMTSIVERMQAAFFRSRA